MRNYTVGYLTAQDALDKRSWSGIHFKMREALESQFSRVVVLGPVKNEKIEKVLDLINKFSLKIIKRRYNKSHNFIRSYYYRHAFKELIKKEKIDVIFAPNASSEIALLKTSIPICYLSGTSFGQIKDYYSYFSDLSTFSIRESDCLEKKALLNSSIQVFPSKWAASFAESYYGANDVNVIPYGANIDKAPEISKLNRDFNSKINLLFLSVDWERKGGELVYNVFKHLIDKNYDVELTVVGCVPTKEHPKMKVVPFLNKNKLEDSKLFEEIMIKTHILFLPTRAECFGIVFCESSAYGILSLSTDTGGVSSAIEDGVNGFLLPLEAKEEEYVNKLEFLLKNRDELRQMSVSSRKKYEEQLNWGEWGKEMERVLTKVIE